MRRQIAIALLASGMMLVSSCKDEPVESEMAYETVEMTVVATATVTETAVETTHETEHVSTAAIENPIITQIITNYGERGEDAASDNEALFDELRGINPESADKWEEILGIWGSINEGFEINEGILPDGLPDTDELCIVVLGFQLNSDGSMRNELIERLNVALESARKYPNAFVLCTGGGTASSDETATEAGRMAEWLTGNGIESDRIIVEDLSLSTAQNAIYSMGILTTRYPQVRYIAIVSSDYHIPNGILMFEAESVLISQDESRISVISNAAYMAPPVNYPPSVMQSAMLEIVPDGT